VSQGFPNICRFQLHQASQIKRQGANSTDDRLLEVLGSGWCTQQLSHGFRCGQVGVLTSTAMADASSGAGAAAAAVAFPSEYERELAELKARNAAALVSTCPKLRVGVTHRSLSCMFGRA
jgi:hypothetical protein